MNETLAHMLKTRLLAALEARMADMRGLGECAWTLRVDNTFGQPSSAA